MPLPNTPKVRRVRRVEAPLPVNAEAEGCFLDFTFAFLHVGQLPSQLLLSASEVSPLVREQGPYSASARHKAPQGANERICGQAVGDLDMDSTYRETRKHHPVLL